jgi:hypothetical protein
MQGMCEAQSTGLEHACGRPCACCSEEQHHVATHGSAWVGSSVARCSLRRRELARSNVAVLSNDLMQLWDGNSYCLRGGRKTLVCVIRWQHKDACLLCVGALMRTAFTFNCIRGYQQQFAGIGGIRSGVIRGVLGNPYQGKP